MICMIIGMDWKEHDNGSWTKTIGTTHVIVKDMRSTYSHLAGGEREYVYVWTSVWANRSNDPYRTLVHRDWSIPSARAWAEKEYS